MSSPASSDSSSPPRTPPNVHQNSIDPDVKWIVQKFGGTSVGKFAVKIAQDVVANYVDAHRVALVCSARSGSTKALGTTNLLLKAAAEALQRRPKSASHSGTTTPKSIFTSSQSSSSPHTSPRSRSSRPGSPAPLFSAFTPLSGSQEPAHAFFETVELIRSEHVNAARNTINSPDILQQLEEEIAHDCEWLQNFLLAAKIIDEISPRSRDSIIGLGERLACKLMTAILQDNGLDAEYVSLEEIVPENDITPAEGTTTLPQDFYDALAATLGEYINSLPPGKIPVITGFFGPVPGSLLRQVGRGYTDLCAALCAVGLSASELQIWKEVDGIFTADPRKVPTARLIPVISPEEAAELTYYGSEVVHPFTMEQVIRKKIPIRIKNVENPTGGGTVIHPEPDAEIDVVGTRGGPGAPEPASVSSLSTFLTQPPSTHTPSNLGAGFQLEENKRLPTAVTIKDHIIVLNIHSNRKSVSHGFLAGIFATLDTYGVVVDLISTSEVHVSMAIEDSLPPKLLERLVGGLKACGSVSVHRSMAILSLVGKQMKHRIGIAGLMFETLAKGHVNIEMISQGASEINISCVIEEKDAVKALNLIHQSCLQIRGPEETQRGRMGPWLF